MSAATLALDAAKLSSWTTLARLGIALGLGAVVGLQREIDGHDAGVRTHALMTLGSALFGLLSVGAFHAFVVPRADTNVQVDVTRIASYLVAGVGFLAGGSVVKSSDRVKGLTTAVSLWVSGGIGLATGLGFIFGAVVATAATVLVLLLEKPIERLTKTKQSITLRVVIRSSDRVADLIERLSQTTHRAGAVRRVEIREDRVEITVTGIPLAAKESLVADLQSRDDVIGLTYEVS